MGNLSKGNINLNKEILEVKTTIFEINKTGKTKLNEHDREE